MNETIDQEYDCTYRNGNTEKDIVFKKLVDFLKKYPSLLTGENYELEEDFQMSSVEVISDMCTAIGFEIITKDDTE